MRMPEITPSAMFLDESCNGGGDTIWRMCARSSPRVPLRLDPFASSWATASCGSVALPCRARASVSWIWVTSAAVSFFMWKDQASIIPIKRFGFVCVS